MFVWVGGWVGGWGGRNVERQIVFFRFCIVLFMATFFVLNYKGRCSRNLPLVINIVIHITIPRVGVPEMSH